MALMISIDDVIKVFRYEDAWIDVITRELNEGITPDVIEKHIVSGDLKEWLDDCKNIITIKLELIAKRHKELTEQQTGLIANGNGR